MVKVFFWYFVLNSPQENCFSYLSFLVADFEMHNVADSASNYKLN